MNSRDKRKKVLKKRLKKEAEKIVQWSKQSQPQPEQQSAAPSL